MAAAYVSPYAGTWYPSDAGELRDLLAARFAASTERTGSALPTGGVGFIVPHAAPAYSGTVAAAVYRNLAASGVRRVVLLGFSHSRTVRGIVAPDIDAYHTPLGDVEVERLDLFRRMSADDVADHSIEVQMPLLRMALPAARVIPLYVGSLDDAERAEAARALASLIGPGTALVASSDWTHYGRQFRYEPFPLDDRTPKRLEELDDRLMTAAGSLDSGLFAKELDSTRSNTCGHGPIRLLLETLTHAGGEELFPERLDYQNSGEITGDFGHSVSYGAVGFFPASSYRVGENDRALLLESARRTLDCLKQTGERRAIQPERGAAGVERRLGVFVTLFKNGKLRGCIGRTGEGNALAESVPELALAAALDDPRFRHSLRGGELSIEISVLTPLKRIRDERQFRVNEHGAALEHRENRGLLLPKVAADRGWSREQFLAALAHKADLPSNVYGHSDTRMFVFRAQTFREG
jgi:AmmeMemoRadiSam system protein B/AmmeMemoRadiSam system protein A